MAVPPLRALVEAGFEVALVVTRPDKRRGRRSEPAPSAVKAAAVELGVPVGHDVDGVLDHHADLGVVVAFGRIIKPHVLEALPMVNLHFSLLPRWRGAAPVERAILAGDRQTGVCVMAVEEGVDTGGVYARAVVDIGAETTAAELRQQLVQIGTPLLVDTLRNGLAPPEPQVGEPTYADKLDPADLRLDWDRPAEELSRRVRVGGAWTTFRSRRLLVHRAVVSAGAHGISGDAKHGELRGRCVTTAAATLELVEVQPEGKGRLSFDAWCNGARPQPGERLGTGDLGSGREGARR